jgi:hypothetical protein
MTRQTRRPHHPARCRCGTERGPLCGLCHKGRGPAAAQAAACMHVCAPMTLFVAALHSSCVCVCSAQSVSPRCPVCLQKKNVWCSWARSMQRARVWALNMCGRGGGLLPLPLLPACRCAACCRVVLEPQQLQPCPATGHSCRSGLPPPGWQQEGRAALTLLRSPN